MPKREDIFQSVLIVSGSEQFITEVKKALPVGRLLSVEVFKNGAAARRQILERYYDIVIVNIPLPDETGEGFAMDVTEICNASVLMAAPQEIFEDAMESVSDHGILVLPKPFPQSRMNQAVRYLMSQRQTVRTMEMKIIKEREKTEELRIVNKAKFYLVEKCNMSEDEAHRYIGKQAMDHGISRKRAAEKILE